jgi:hypothetical protein
MADVTTHNHGSVILFELHTDEVRAWVTEHVQVEDYQWFGSNQFAVEHRYAGDLADGMSEAGFELRGV